MAGAALAPSVNGHLPTSRPPGQRRRRPGAPIVLWVLSACQLSWQSCDLRNAEVQACTPGRLGPVIIFWLSSCKLAVPRPGMRTPPAVRPPRGVPLPVESPVAPSEAGRVVGAG